MMLLERNATVTVCHTKTKNLAALCREAEILVVAIGHGKMIGREYLSPGQVIVDIGINFDENGKMCGDVDYEAASETAHAVTPVPGGIGKVTTAVLAKHVVEACSRSPETDCGAVNFNDSAYTIKRAAFAALLLVFDLLCETCGFLLIQPLRHVLEEDVLEPLDGGAGAA